MLQKEPLVELLTKHKAFNDREAEHLSSATNWLRLGGEFWSRKTFDPGHVTASVFLMNHKLDHIILIYNQKLQKWLQPGGHYEPNDRNLYTTVIRETKEEAGIEIRPEILRFFDIDVHRIPDSKKEPAHLHFDFRFHAIVPQHKLTAGTDAADAKWIAVKHLKRYNVVDEGISRMLAKVESVTLEAN